MKLPRKLTPPGIRSTVIISSKHVPIRYGLGNQFSVHVYTPTAASIGLRPSLIMFHGGGWTHGTPEMDEELARLFASELRAVVINVDYRLAPEHPFPEPLNDCYTALDWAINNATEYMIDTARIGLWGFSSGGNLAAAVALKDSIEQPVPRVKHVSLVAPVTCHPDLYPPALRSNGSSAQTFGQGGSVPSTIAMCKFWCTFICCLFLLTTLVDECPAGLYANTSFSHPYASILLADPPKHHPPVHISVAARDMLRDEGIAYALRLRNRGIDTQLEVIPGVPHEFILWPDTIVSKQFVHCQVKVLDYALNCQV